ncbi:hypothetical protein H072_4673 [Dactylellina haptotyla CBS 200.50]|uniref:Aminoglycoside phosphotransferase domain-containing protein n=1 Tax=Dactylellina haptotyla (strain CBS 200.50) TaxID=1284197 RepID=S8AEV8_DACHA|nr:hypothetical protein H072_4673 [Dactylellina haptotyla CBS 200.50]
MPDHKISIRVSELPAEKNVDFIETSFFHENNSRKLPTPSEVRSRATHPRTHRPDPIRFTEDNLIVKWGEYVTIAEGQVYWMLQTHLKGEIPAPEIYGWRTEGNQVFLYLEYITENQLEEVHHELGTESRSKINSQIRSIKTALLRLRQNPTQEFLGSIGGQPLPDTACEDDDNLAGPPPSVAAFHCWLTDRALKRFPDPEPTKPLREMLPDNVPIVFSHCDLHPKNILVSPAEPSKIVAIVDWHQSGWYPSYWERCKAEWGNYGDWIVENLPEVSKDDASGDHEGLFKAFCMYCQLLSIF